jgi:hypothetical protein
MDTLFGGLAAFFGGPNVPDKGYNLERKKQIYIFICSFL